MKEELDSLEEDMKNELKRVGFWEVLESFIKT